MKKNKILILIFIVFFVFLLPIFSENVFDVIRVVVNRLPVIESLSHRDLVFRQLTQTVEFNERQLAVGRDFFCEFYIYRCPTDEPLIFLAADMLLPYDTISTLNGISDSSVSMMGRELVIPSVKGVFVAADPRSSLEILLSREFSSECQDNVPVYEINGRRFFFLAGKRFTSTQRAFFLDAGFRLPLDTKVISSAYGYRVSPVYGRWKFHKGVDFAAREGDDVYAVKHGEVKFVARNDPVFGNYIILSHSDGMTSVYAHLSRILVENGRKISGGQVVGNVGQTGMTTGPHLHFEIRKDGEAENPMQFLK